VTIRLELLGLLGLLVVVRLFLKARLILVDLLTGRVERREGDRSNGGSASR
jgi:hypothetical protein